MLRARGHDACTVLEQGLAGVSDDGLGAVCRREGRALLTMDKGFADVRVHRPALHRGLIVLRLGTQEKRHLLARVEALAHRLAHESADGQLWVVDESGVRIRE